MNKIVLITGASSGIGEATARVLADVGMTVALGARRTDRLDRLAAEITAAGGTARVSKRDVTNPVIVAAFAQNAIDTFGRVDVLINNAGGMPLSPMASLKVDE
jgi:NADP-dependent 3-hydroxy acid dehydrogenase YdfG